MGRARPTFVSCFTIAPQIMIEVTSKEFREKQAGILELADRGERVIIKRRRKPAYTLVPVDDDAAYFTPEMLKKIDRSLKQAEAGDVKRISSIEEIDRFLGLWLTSSTDSIIRQPGTHGAYAIRPYPVEPS